MVIIPAYQAQATIGSLVEEVRGLGLPVLVVDDASTDGTPHRAREAGAELLQRSENGGKGCALRDGLAWGCQAGYHWLVTMDADGQHLAAEISPLLEKAKERGVDLVIGNRMGDPSGMPWERRLTNQLMSWWISRMTGDLIPDTQCGFRVIPRRILECVKLTSDRFEIESELVIRSIWAGFRVASVPVSSVYKAHSSFIRPLRDTVRFFRLIRRLRRERSCL